MAVANATTSSGTGDTDTIRNPSRQEEIDQNPNPVLSFLSNLLKIVKLPPLPFLPLQKHQRATDSEAVQPTSGVVSYPRREFASGKLEAEAVRVRETQPFVVWQERKRFDARSRFCTFRACAIGGILVLRWAWVRWNERRSRKPPKDTPPPADG